MNVLKRTAMLFLVLVGLAVPCVSRGQISVSSGDYHQGFNNLATNGTANAWTENSTLPGWYASRVIGGAWSIYRGETGASNAGALDSFGSAASTDRALGSTASGTPGNIAFGLRIVNDTLFPVPVSLSFTGEQWRNGGNIVVQTLAFSYRISNSPITDSDAAAAYSWTPYSGFSFNSPTVGATAAALDGNDAANRQVFSLAPITGVTLLPGQEIFLRWFDINDLNNDHGMGIDDLTVSFAPVPEPSTVSLIALGVLVILGRRSILRTAS